MVRTFPWFRMYYEARTDAKLHSLADDEFRVWFNLLCYAAEQVDDRGAIDTEDGFLVAVEVAGGDEELLHRTLHKLERLRIIEWSEDESDHRMLFSHFDDRQYDKPSDAPEQTRERKRKSRAQQQQSADVTPMSRPVTPSHAQEEKRVERDREEKRGEKTENAHPRDVHDSSPSIEFAIAPDEPEPTSGKRVPTPEWQMLETVWHVQDADPTVLPQSERAKQLRVAGRMIQSGYTAADAGSVTRWILSQGWLTSAVDLFMVEKQMAKWEIAGRPDGTRPVRGAPETTLDRNMRNLATAFGHEEPNTIIETQGVLRR